tara:strand:+ start:157 stop:747 length:591 start_codon:yes stop_codon:yes gene_type:complete
MKKSPLNFIGAMAADAASSISSNSNSAASRAAIQSAVGSITGGNSLSSLTGGVAQAFGQDPNYMAADPNITRASSGGSGANYSTNADPAAIYGDAETGPNSRYADGRGPNITRLLHDNGMFDGPQVGGLIQSKGQRDARNEFLAQNTANAATANNFSAGTQNMAGKIYGTPQSMDSSITPPITENIDQAGINSLYS